MTELTPWHFLVWIVVGGIAVLVVLIVGVVVDEMFLRRRERRRLSASESRLAQEVRDASEHADARLEGIIKDLHERTTRREP